METPWDRGPTSFPRLAAGRQHRSQCSLLTILPQCGEIRPREGCPKCPKRVIQPLPGRPGDSVAVCFRDVRQLAQFSLDNSCRMCVRLCLSFKKLRVKENQQLEIMSTIWERPMSSMFHGGELVQRLLLRAVQRSVWAWVGLPWFLTSVAPFPERFRKDSVEKRTD